MLLAVLDLARAGALVDKRIVYAPPLLERYRRFFDAVRAPSDPPLRVWPAHPHPWAFVGEKTGKRRAATMAASCRGAPMTTSATLEARVDLLSLAVECLARSLSTAQAREVTASLHDGLSLLLAQRGQVSAEVDAALAAQAGPLMQALRR